MSPPEEQERLLYRNVLLSRNSAEPLHAQLTRSLRNLVVRHFEEGERFYPEEELAEKLGLSVGTVRRSLNRLVQEGLLQRRRGQGSFVSRTGLNRNQGLRVAAMVNTFDSVFNGMVLRELSYLCHRRGHSLEVINPGQDERVSRAIDSVAIPSGQIGFIFLCLEHDFTYDLLQAMQGRHVPSVNIDTWISGYPGIQIGVDNRLGIELGLDHLRELGHRRVALLLSEWAEHENIRERVEAFHKGISERGLEGSVVEPSPLPEFADLSAELHFPTQERYNARIDDAVARRVLETRASAVLCVSDAGACLLMKRLQMAGRRIPEDISVMGFNDEGGGLLVYPELTTIAQPFAAMATTALDSLESFDSTQRHIRLEPALTIRKSTGPAPDGPADAGGAARDCAESEAGASRLIRDSDPQSSRGVT